MSSDLTRLEEILRTLSLEQLRYLAVRASVRFDYEAAEAIGIARETVSRWDNKPDVDEAVKLMLIDGVMVAQEVLRRNTSKAAMEIADELDHAGVNIRHMAAVDILDRALGKALQKTDITSEGKAIQVVGVGVRPDEL